MKKILFVVNPIAGGRDKNKIVDYINKTIDKRKYEYSIMISEKPHHGYYLVDEVRKRGDADIVVAVGGDGTINDVVNAITGSEITLGIIPVGSGNGLARYLNIPTDYRRALDIILNGETCIMDTFEVVSEKNNKPIIATSLVGVGFDALVAKKFVDSTVRGFQTYAKIVLEDYPNYQPRTYKLIADNVEITTQALFIALANSDRYGFNAVIAPEASVEDGLIDVSIVKKIPFYSILQFAYQLFTRSILDSEYVDSVKTKRIKIMNNVDELVNIDGEPYKLGPTLDICVNPKSLKVIGSRNVL